MLELRVVSGVQSPGSLKQQMLPNPDVPGQAYRRLPSRGLIETAGIADFSPWDVLPLEPWNPLHTHSAHLGTSVLLPGGGWNAAGRACRGVGLQGWLVEGDASWPTGREGPRGR